MAMKAARTGRSQPQQHLQRHGEEQGFQKKQTHRSQHQQQQKYYQEGKGYGSGPTDRKNLPGMYGRRPPRPLTSSDPWRQAFPLWEKRFCIEECRIPWGKICETRRFMHMYPDVMEWNDSAGEEALHDAKCRYWAKINGLPCDTPLPDPDMYIDIVDPDAHIDDPELVEYFNQMQSAVTDDEASVEGDCILDYKDIPIPVSGWGDEEDPVPVPVPDYKEIPIPVSGWGVEEDPAPDAVVDSVPVTGCEDIADASVPVTGWGNTEYAFPASGWGDEEDTVSDRPKDKACKQRKGYANNGGRTSHGKKRVNGCQFGSRFAHHKFKEDTRKPSKLLEKTAC